VRRHILLFDQHELALAIYVEGLRLQMPDVLVDTATHVAEALSKASATAFDVIVCHASLCQIDEADLIGAFNRLCPEAVLINIVPMHEHPHDVPVRSIDIHELNRLVRVALGSADQADRRRHFRRAS
jgi:hypothetical protein